jgi:hypothetical protein
MRMPRMQGFPPHCSGLGVMRDEAMGSWLSSLNLKHHAAHQVPGNSCCCHWGRGPGSVPLGLTLIEAQKVARRAEQLAVLKTFAEGELLRRLPFRNLVGGSLSFPAETKLPRFGFRAVNEGYRQRYGVINSDSEFVHLFGGDQNVDRSIVDLQGPEARAAQTEMKVRSMRLTLEAAIINGDDTFDPLIRGPSTD